MDFDEQASEMIYEANERGTAAAANAVTGDESGRG